MKPLLLILLAGASFNYTNIARADDEVKNKDKKEEEKKTASTAAPVCGQKNLTLSNGETLSFLRCQTTSIINQSLGLVEGAQNTANIFVQGNANKKIIEESAKKGANLTVKDNLNAQKDMHESAANLFYSQALVQGSNALTEGGLSVSHFSEANKARNAIKKEQELITSYNNGIMDRTQRIEQANLVLNNPESDPASKASAQEDLECSTKDKQEFENNLRVANANIQILTTEAESQNQMGQKQAEVAAASANRAAETGLKGNDSRLKAAQLGAEASALTNSGSGQFTYNPQSNLGMNEGGLLPNAGTDPNVLGPIDPLAPAALNDPFKEFNPNSGNDSVLGAGSGESGTSGSSSGGGGSGLGMGGAGGTSGARGDGEGRGEGGPAGKSQTGGMYATSGEGGSKFGRSGSSGVGVGLSSGFGDLLKKFLPGNEDKKDQRATLDLNGDRGPASDQAAVIGRNKNIFVEISKRYQKKNSEGAVMFQ